SPPGCVPTTLSARWRPWRPSAWMCAAGSSSRPAAKIRALFELFWRPYAAMTIAPTSATPAARGRFGPYGGQYVPETIMPALTELEAGFRAAMADEAFQAELRRLLKTYVGRPTPLHEAARFAARVGAGPVWLKREDLAHTGAH